MKVRFLIFLGLGFALFSRGATNLNWFAAGTNAYGSGDFAEAARLFREAVSAQPSSGGLVNLGLAQWQQGHVGAAILAWEQALWIDPFERRARNNLRFARLTAQLESPELTWYEAGSTWLPANAWAWIAGGSLSLVVALLTLPGVLRWRKSPWQQAAAALALGVLIFSLPVSVGVLTRTQLGIVLERDAPLRLTPTAEGEAVTRLAAGEPARRVNARGNYVFVKTSRGAGWIRQEEFGWICPP